MRCKRGLLVVSAKILPRPLCVPVRTRVLGLSSIDGYPSARGFCGFPLLAGNRPRASFAGFSRGRFFVRLAKKGEILKECGEGNARERRRKGTAEKRRSERGKSLREEGEKKMIWNGVRNYLRGLKYAFVPLGTLFLGLILGFSVFLPRAAGEVKEFADGAAKVTGEGAVRYEELLDSLAARVLELDWDNPLAACAAMLDEGWINGTLEECVEPFVEEYDRYAESIKGLALDAADGIAAAAAAVGIFAALGIAGGFFLTKWFLRRELAPRSF